MRVPSTGAAHCLLTTFLAKDGRRGRLEVPGWVWALKVGRGLKAIRVGLDEAPSPSEPHLPCVENGVSPRALLLADVVSTLGFQVLTH